MYILHIGSKISHIIEITEFNLIYQVLLLYNN